MSEHRPPPAQLLQHHHPLPPAGHRRSGPWEHKRATKRHKGKKSATPHPPTSLLPQILPPKAASSGIVPNTNAPTCAAQRQPHASRRHPLKHPRHRAPPFLLGSPLVHPFSPHFTPSPQRRPAALPKRGACSPRWPASSSRTPPWCLKVGGGRACRGSAHHKNQRQDPGRGFGGATGGRALLFSRAQPVLPLSPPLTTRPVFRPPGRALRSYTALTQPLHGIYTAPTRPRRPFVRGQPGVPQGSLAAAAPPRGFRGKHRGRPRSRS